MTAEPSSQHDPLTPFAVGDDEPDVFVDYRLGVADLRRHLGDVVTQAAYADRYTVITRNGRPAAAVVPIAALGVLERVLEDRDAQTARRAVASGEPPAAVEDLLAEFDEQDGTGHRREIYR